jgi:hypothetical protein
MGTFPVLGSEANLDISDFIQVILTASVVEWSEFLATDPEVPGSVHGATRFSEK